MSLLTAHFDFQLVAIVYHYLLLERVNNFIVYTISFIIIGLWPWKVIGKQFVYHFIDKDYIDVWKQESKNATVYKFPNIIDWFENGKFCCQMFVENMQIIEILDRFIFKTVNLQTTMVECTNNQRTNRAKQNIMNTY